MRLPQMTTRRWMLVVAVLALSLVVVTRLVVPIVWDLRGRARDDHWLRVEANNAQGGLSYEEWCRKTGI
jgi:hypothetical protein